MIYTIIKVIITNLLIVAISELSKRSSLLGALLALLPLTSVLAMLWFYIDTKEVGKVADLAASIFWLVSHTLPGFFHQLTRFAKEGATFLSEHGTFNVSDGGMLFSHDLSIDALWH